MTIRSLPVAPVAGLDSRVRFQPSMSAMERWQPGIHAAASKEDDRSISVYDVIGQDYWTGEGVTTKRVAGALRALGKGPVTVNVNSPGGDLFEGLAIYNLLREHDGEVTVKVLGVAASAASIIAMAGDSVEIARAGFLMIHNTWVGVVGNRNDLRDVADKLEPFDRAMAGIYVARTGGDEKAMGKQMDRETWIGGTDAIEQGFADDYLPSDQVAEDKQKAHASAPRRLEAALRASGMSKAAAMRLISEVKSSAGDPAGGGEGDPTEGGYAAEQYQAALVAGLKSFSLKP